MSPTRSIVIFSCLYDDWLSASDLYITVGKELAHRGQAVGLVLVNDGSLETRPADFLRGVAGFSSIKIINLRKNLGHQRAIAVGLSYIFETGLEKDAAVAVMDCDGEDRPEDLFRLLEAHAELAQPGLLFAERTRRSESFTFRFFYQVYCAAHLLLTGYRIRFGNFSVVPFSLLGRLVVDPNLWLHFAATAVAGRLPYTTITSHRGRRLHGRSKLNFVQLVAHGLAALSCYNEIVAVRLFFSAMSFCLILGLLGAASCIAGLVIPAVMPSWIGYMAGFFFVVLIFIGLLALALASVAISSRRSNFFLPIQQYRFLIDDIAIIA